MSAEQSSDREPGTPASSERRALPPRSDARDDDFCYLTTRGRTSGNPHEIEIWFAMSLTDQTLWLLSGGGERSDWVRNLRAEPAVTVRLRDIAYPGTARVVEAGTTEDDDGRRAVFEKYRARYSGSLDDWRVRALLVAIDLEQPSGREPGIPVSSERDQDAEQPSGREPGIPVSSERDQEAEQPSGREPGIPVSSERDQEAEQPT